MSANSERSIQEQNALFGPAREVAGISIVNNCRLDAYRGLSPMFRRLKARHIRLKLLVHVFERWRYGDSPADGKGEALEGVSARSQRLSGMALGSRVLVHHSGRRQRMERERRESISHAVKSVANAVTDMIRILACEMRQHSGTPHERRGTGWTHR